MRSSAHVAYAPINALKPFAADIWIVDGPEIAMRYLGTSIPFPTRMTVVRLASGQLWVHSPIAWDEGLAAAVVKLGPVSWLVAPNSLHYWYLPVWQAKFPAARSYGVSTLHKRARRPVRLDEELTDEPPRAWGDTFHQCLLPGSLLTEVDFFHLATRTLVLTDLIENFELDRVRRAWMRWALRLFGGAAPDGTAPRDMRWSFIGHRRQVRAAVRRMIAWAPERIVLAHGRCYERDGVAELRRAFRWVL